MGVIFGVLSRCVFEVFLDASFIDLGDILDPFGFRFLVKKSTLGTPGRDKVDREKSLFYLGKTILFNFGGCPRTPKIDRGGVIKPDTIS